MGALLRHLAVWLLLLAGIPAHAQPPLTLGVFALRPRPLVESMWQPFVDYLGEGLQREVRLRVLDSAEMRDALARHELDLVLTNPTHLIELRASNPLSGAIATQLTRAGDRVLRSFGGVILARRDTPGLRTLRLDADADTLDGVFDDIARWSAQCRFRDCRHQDEPGCAVRAQADPGRLRNFHKLRRELQRDAMSALERKEERQIWKVRHKAARARDRAKREPA